MVSSDTHKRADFLRKLSERMKSIQPSLAKTIAETAIRVLRSPRRFAFAPTRELKSSTFEAFSEVWVRDYLSLSKRSTQATMRGHIKRLGAAFGQKDMRKIDAGDLQRIFVDMEQQGKERKEGCEQKQSYSPKTFRNLWITTRLIWQAALAQEYVDKIPAKPKLPKVFRRPARSLSLEEVAKIIANSKGAYTVFYWLKAETGMRVGELCALSLSDVTADSITVEKSVWNGTFDDPKSENAKRRIAISSQLSALLAAQVKQQRSKQHTFLFSTSTGSCWDANLVRERKFKPLLAELGIQNGKLHSFRHFNISLLARRRVPLKTIQERVSDKTLRIPAMSWNGRERSWNILEPTLEGEQAIWPIDEKNQERVWSLNHVSAIDNMNELEVRVSKDGSPQVFRRHRPADGVLPRSWWDKNTYAAREYGSAALTQLFGAAVFSFAKSPFAVQDSLWVSGLARESDREVLDFFAGSGTTAHAVINLNREDGGSRRFVLVDMGDYFESVLLPRIKKIMFSPEWKDGKPTREATQEEIERSPRIVKVLRLESYDDTLNNLETERTSTQQGLLDTAEAQGAGGLKEQFVLRYMLDVDTRGSQSLLSVEAFRDPLTG